VAFVLLLLVTYNVTAELVHRHGQPLPTHTTTATAAGRTSTDETTAKPSSSDLCLLCQFQQQLALGLLHTPPFTFRSLTMTAGIIARPNRYLPLTNTPPRGRAPPLASPA
jgi:hypothetical protein